MNPTERKAARPDVARSVFCAALVFLALSVHCGRADLTSPLYFVALPFLRAGQERPTAPLNLRATYESIQKRIALRWDPGADPDSAGPVLLYRVYFFLNGPPPANIYQPRYFLDEAVGFGYTASSDPFTGDVYFAVTAYDGAAESLPSNSARLNLTASGGVVP